jgi:hypothetical protein
MRYIVSIFVACIASQVCGDVITVGWDHFVNGRSDYFNQLFSTNHISIVVITLMLHPIAYAIFDRPLTAFSGLFLVNLRLKYALAYALFLVMVSVLFVWPLNSFTADVNLIISVIGFVSGFVGGYLRGWLVDHWTGGRRHRTLAA